jgi:hypothetical protein
MPGLAAVGAAGRDGAPRTAQNAQPSRSAAEPPTPEPKPIAVIVVGLPIEDFIVKLTAIQADHPGTQIRRGKRNRWEIWPPERRTGR